MVKSSSGTAKSSISYRVAPSTVNDSPSVTYLAGTYVINEMHWDTHGASCSAVMSAGRFQHAYISQPMEIPFTVVPRAVVRLGAEDVPNEDRSVAEDMTSATMFSDASWKLMYS